MKTRKKLTALILALCACVIAGCLILFTTCRFISYSSLPCVESARELRNPYTGWYQIYKYDLSDASACDLTGIQDLEHGAGLALLEFNLQGFANGPVSESALTLLEHILKNWQAAGRQLIIRFLYDWDGNALEKEPGELTVILGHMTQTAEVINRYPDCVYIIQGLFIGSWGEMHGSRYANTDDMITLAEHLYEITDPSIFLAVRTPEQWRLLAGSNKPLTEDSAYDGSLASRLSLFNDGMMGSSTDLNTYAEDSSPVPATSYGMRNRKDELAFQNLLCAYVPNGGEAVIDNPYNDFPAAIETLASTHVSYLNEAYDPAVLAKWKAASYTGDGPYHGMNGFDYISRHLGYRYVLRSLECPGIFPWKKEGKITLTLENTGFSTSFRSFDGSVILKNTQTGRTHILPLICDTRFFLPGTQLTLNTTFHTHEYSAGTYDLYLKITDPATDLPVLPANEGTLTEDGFLIGSLKISRYPWGNIS